MGPLASLNAPRWKPYRLHHDVAKRVVLLDVETGRLGRGLPCAFDAPRAVQGKIVYRAVPKLCRMPGCKATTVGR
jgi:hypothetical protein